MADATSQLFAAGSMFATGGMSGMGGMGGGGGSGIPNLGGGPSAAYGGSIGNVSVGAPGMAFWNSLNTTQQYIVLAAGAVGALIAAPLLVKALKSVKR